MGIRPISLSLYIYIQLCVYTYSVYIYVYVYSNTFHGISVHIHLQAVEEQFADGDYDITVRNVKFQSATGDDDQAIEIKFESPLPYGWSITRKSGRKVSLFQSS